MRHAGRWGPGRRGGMGPATARVLWQSLPGCCGSLPRMPAVSHGRRARYPVRQYSHRPISC
eukprot:117396-Chlamydomonas_euryale.AAC.1